MSRVKYRTVQTRDHNTGRQLYRVEELGLKDWKILSPHFDFEHEAHDWLQWKLQGNQVCAHYDEEGNYVDVADEFDIDDGPDISEVDRWGQDS